MARENSERGNMPIAGNPKKLAYDVAQGYQQFTQATLRPYTLEDLKVLIFNPPPQPGDQHHPVFRRLERPQALKKRKFNPLSPREARGKGKIS
jgi:hypothetical protein